MISMMLRLVFPPRRGEASLKEQVDSLEQNLSKHIKEKECLLQRFSVFKSESKEKEDKYMENEIDLEKKIKKLDNIIFKVGQSTQTMNMLTKPQAFYHNIHKQALGYQNPFYLRKAQRIKPTLYDGSVISDKHVVMAVIDDEETLILEEESRSKMSKKEKDPEAIKQNISHKPIDYEKLNRLSDDFGKCFTLQQELSAEQAFWLRMFNPTSKPFDASPVKIKAPKELPKVILVNESVKKLKFHLARFDNVVKIRTTPDARTKGISIKALIQLNQEIFQKDESCNNQNALEIPEFFENNDLKAQLEDKDNTICKLKDIIKSMREKLKEENANYNDGEIETKIVELENSVAKMILENERLCNEINHVKQVFKEQFDSIRKTCIRTKEQCDSLINKLNLKSAENKDLKAQIQDKVFVITSLKNDLRKLKGKEIVDIAAQTPSAHTIIPVEQAKAKQPLDKELDIACKHAQRIQELLVYVRDTCLNAINLSAKKVVVTPKNKVKKVRFAKPLTFSSNIKQIESSKTSDSNTPVLSSTGLKCSTNKCGSKPTGNKKNDKISRTPNRNMQNKEEAQPRKVNKKNSVIEPIRDVNVKHSVLNANSEPICATCKKSMFDGVHDMCLFNFVENVNSHAKSTKKHKKQNIWNPTGHVFTKVGFKWKPTGKTFTIVGNLWPLTRITSANVVQIIWYLDSGCSKHMIGNRSQLMNFVSKFLGTVRFGNGNIARIIGYGDYHLGNVTISRVYYVEGLGYNMFSVGQFCDADLEVAFWKNTCFIHNLEGVDLLFGSPCALGKRKKSSHKPKADDTNQEKLYLLHMDLCGPMRVASINEKSYILVIVDDYSRFTWVRFLRTKDEAQEAIIKCIKNIQVRLNATIRNVRTDNGTEFVNQTLREFVNQTLPNTVSQ
ncbi:retrovirus-related pol polyprotein from transposon TNT 1-94 [Tanacetum coccineum]